MHTSGWVVTFVDDPALARGAQLELASAGPFTLGESLGCRRAVTLEASDPQTAHDWHEWVQALPGIEGVEVVFVHWDDCDHEVAHAGA